MQPEATTPYSLSHEFLLSLPPLLVLHASYEFSLWFLKTRVQQRAMASRERDFSRESLTPVRCREKEKREKRSLHRHVTLGLLQFCVPQKFITLGD